MRFPEALVIAAALALGPLAAARAEDAPIARIEAGGTVFAVAFSPDGKLLAHGGNSEKVHVVDVASRKELKALAGHKDTVTGVAFGADAKTIVSTGDDNRVIVWDVEGGKAAKKQKLGSDIGGLAVTRDGRLAATAEDSDLLTIWELPALREARKIVLGGDSVAFSADGTKVVASDIDISVYEVASGRELREIDNPGGAVHDTAVSPRGDWIAVACDDHTVRLYALETGKPGAILKGHGDEARAVAFSPDGARLASSSRGEDRTVRVWDVASGKCVKSLAHESDVNAVAFSPDGKLLATGCDGSAVFLWQVGP